MLTQFLIGSCLLIVGFIVLLVLYFAGWEILYALAPKWVEQYRLGFVLKDIRHYFGFLFEKGFEIRKTDYSEKSFGNWSVRLETRECVILIIQDRLELQVGIVAQPAPEHLRHFADLATLVYRLSDGKVMVEPFRGNLSWGKKRQFERLSNLLRDHIDEILAWCGANPGNDPYDYWNEIRREAGS
jgi:hypothetical protein